MELTNREWQEFFITDIAEIISGQDIYEKERIKGETPYISATANVNGIGYFVDNNNKTLERNCLSVNRNGSVGYSFFHPYKALFSNDCRKLRLKFPNKYVGIFISHIITRQKEKYGYGYKMGTERLKRQKILLPVTSQGKPDYEFMENYMQQKEIELLEAYKNHLLTLKPSEKVNEEVEWKEFVIEDVFEIKNSKAYHKTQLTETENNGISYISRTNLNNGLESIVKNENFKINKANTIVFGAENAMFFYQPSNYITGNKMYFIENNSLNKHTALFIQMALNHSIENCGFGYGKGLTGTRVEKRMVLLPVNSDGNPDYVYMENYMKALEYEKLKQYLDYKKLNTND